MLEKFLNLIVISGFLFNMINSCQNQKLMPWTIRVSNSMDVVT